MRLPRLRPRPALALALLSASALAAVTAGCSDGRHAVRASGIIEMDEVDVASLVGGRVGQLRVREGDTVRAGDTLAVLDRDEVMAELRLRAAEAERAAAQAREVVIGPRAEEIRMARAALSAAEATLELAEAEFQRTQELHRGGVASQAEFDRARSARDEARAARDAAGERLHLLEAGSRREQILAAQQAAAAAQAALAAARTRLGELVLVAPISGVVLLRNFEPGELALAGQPVLTLGNPDSLWLRAFVAAPRITRVRLGAPVAVQVSGDRRRFPGRIAEIATRAEFTPRAALTEEERANIVFAVKIALAPSGGALKAGVPADALIEAARE
jgi:HlyD family secretion protein